jgi:hypothetical protein
MYWIGYFIGWFFLLALACLAWTVANIVAFEDDFKHDCYL